MADIFDELQQDIEQERWVQLWKKYHNHIYGIVGAILLTTAGYAWYNQYKQSTLSQSAEQYFRGLQLVVNKSDKSVNKFDQIATDYSNIYATLSRFWAASLLSQRGEDEKAAAVYDTTLSNNNGLTSLWRKPQSLMKELAIFKKAYATIDQADPQVLRKLIKPFAHEDDPWKFSAYEILALLEIRENHSLEAKKYLQKIISNKNASATVKLRAEILMGTLISPQSA